MIVCWKIVYLTLTTNILQARMAHRDIRQGLRRASIQVYRPACQVDKTQPRVSTRATLSHLLSLPIHHIRTHLPHTRLSASVQQSTLAHMLVKRLDRIRNTDSRTTLASPMRRNSRLLVLLISSYRNRPRKWIADTLYNSFPFSKPQNFHLLKRRLVLQYIIMVSRLPKALNLNFKNLVRKLLRIQPPMVSP